MPGPQVKNWDQYEALRDKGYSKESSAKITNAGVRKAMERRLASKKS